MERLDPEADHEGSCDRHRCPESRCTLDEGTKAKRHEQELQPAVGRDPRDRLLHDLELAGEDGNVVEIDRRQHDPGDLQHAESDSVHEAHGREPQRHPEDDHGDRHRRSRAGDRAPVRLHAQACEQAK